MWWQSRYSVRYRLQWTNSGEQMTADITVETAHPMPAEADYDRRFLEPEIETASREQIAALQEQRILELVPYVWERSPFYREIWSVAPPLPTHYARNFWEMGLRPGDKVLMPPGSFRGYFDDFLHMMGMVPIYIDCWIGQGEKVLQAIERYQVDFVQLFLPMVLEFEKLEKQYDMKAMLSSLKGAAFAGMPLGKMLTEKVRDQWGVDLYTYTSAGDTGTAREGQEHDGYVLWEDTVLAETLDTITGAPVGDREMGELVATDLDNWAAPYIRFRSGDVVRITQEPAASGCTHARMWVLGRSGDEML